MANVKAASFSYKAAPAAVAATTSPQVLTNAGGDDIDLIVTGGTVSLIEFSRDGVTYFDTGLTVGVFTLSPGDSLRVTYSANPTMTLVPR